MYMVINMKKDDFIVNRDDIIQIADDYLEYEKGIKEKGKASLRKKIISLNYREILILQSSEKRWFLLMSDPNIYFKRKLCAGLYNLVARNIAENIGVKTTAAHNLLNNTNGPKTLMRSYRLAIMFNHPWQLVIEKNPVKLTYREYAEYLLDGVAKGIIIKEIYKEKENVDTISGYVIFNPNTLFEQEISPITGRWVTTYPEMDYFEFHLSHEPILHKKAINQILDAFPNTSTILTTYTPFRPEKRSLWVLIPKSDKFMSDYNNIIRELRDHRDRTVIFYNE